MKSGVRRRILELEGEKAMATTANLGYPRFGAKRELKRALEGYWSGKTSAADLLETGKQLRITHWQLQQDAGIDFIPSNDFSFYELPTRSHPSSSPPSSPTTGSNCSSRILASCW